MEQVPQPADHRTTLRAPVGVLATIRTGFWLLERVAPGPGSALAERIWCRLPSAGATGRRDLRPGRGEPVTARIGGRRIVGEAWGDGPTIYLSSGWGGWRGQVGAFVEPLVSSGYRVIAFDALSHGESDPGQLGPRLSTLNEFADSLAAIVAAAGDAYGIIAHSAGCGAVALAAADGLPVKQLVFISPMADPRPYVGDFRRIVGCGPRIEAGLVARLERRGGRPLADFSIPALAERIAVPLLVVHDRRDKETRFADGVSIAERWPGAELMATEGLGHRRILGDPAVVARVADFFADRRASGG